MAIETRSINNHQKEVNPNTSSIQALGSATLKAIKWYQDLAIGKIDSVKAIAVQENISVRFIQERLKLELLSPQMIKNLFEGKIEDPPNLEQLKMLQFTYKWVSMNSLS